MLKKIIRMAVLLTLVFGTGLVMGARTSKGTGTETETLESATTQDMSLSGAVYESAGGTRIKLLLDGTNLGGTEIEVGEITLAAGTNSGSHPHGSTEIFYILSGELDHVVNDEHHLLKPGMLGFVRPPDRVNHIVPGTEPVKALVIWAPGGEAQRIVGNWKKVP